LCSAIKEIANVFAVAGLFKEGFVIPGLEKQFM